MPNTKPTPSQSAPPPHRAVRMKLKQIEDVACIAEYLEVMNRMKMVMDKWPTKEEDRGLTAAAAGPTLADRQHDDEIAQSPCHAQSGSYLDK